MNPFMWIVWGVGALLFLLVVLVALAVVLVLVTPCVAVVVALFEDVRDRWRVRLMRRRAQRTPANEDDELVGTLAAMPEPSPFCSQHQPWGSDEKCGPCGGARKRYALWSQASGMPDLLMRPAWTPVAAGGVVESDDMAVVDATTDHGRAL